MHWPVDCSSGILPLFPTMRQDAAATLFMSEVRFDNIFIAKKLLIF
jgi:hypothetical protein